MFKNGIEVPSVFINNVMADHDFVMLTDGPTIESDIFYSLLAAGQHLLSDDDGDADKLHFVVECDDRVHPHIMFAIDMSLSNVVCFTITGE